jgi:hypothetical protein
MRCGKGHEHGTVAEVRACYGVGESGATATATATDGYRPNKFAGVCVLCGAKVAEGEGRIDRRESGTGWNVSHLKGECPKRKASAIPESTITAPDYSAVPGGYYATESLTGNNDLDFWFVKEGTRNPQVRFVKRIIGGRGGPERVHMSTARAALAAILTEGIDKCGDRFADELGRCRDCGLPLTDKISRDERRGPICRNK